MIAKQARISKGNFRTMAELSNYVLVLKTG